ncbi:transmembrane protein 240 [Puntigrus tetrazona]|uniref:transmembrane protein 240 n=1 Tax=Puntigrus tetrazona TaxID=1606681 RepID=UPI001C89EA01|nr:transmembrane protein 240 [Puntigrus tetrazona]
MKMLLVVSGAVLALAVVCMSDMNALLDRFHNFILPRMRGPERVCHCTCGRHAVEYVIPYEGPVGSVGASGAGSVSKQELDLVLGLLMGFCISWVLLWLDAALGSWRSGRHHGSGGCVWRSWRWVSRVCSLRELRRRLQTRRWPEDASSKHRLCHNGRL